MSTPAARQYNFVDDKNNAIPITSARVDAELDNCIAKLNQKVIIQASAPSSPIAGMLWYDTSTNFLKQYRNSEWVQMGVVQKGTVMATPQEGDLWLDDSGSEVVVKVRNKANSAWLTLAQSTDVYVTGEIKMWPTNTAPTGYLLCDGTAVSRTTYATLFALIGTVYGAGDASTTFNVPDFRGLMPVGRKSTDANFDILKTPTTYVGEKTHVLTLAELASHNHGIHNSNGGGGGGGDTTNLQKTDNTNLGGINTNSAGSDSAHNNMPPYIVINFIIRT